MNKQKLLESIGALVRHEANAIATLESQSQAVADAAQICAACKGRLIVTGLGKSGIVARKIASTLTSIGKAAIFLHPTEAVHGELGIVSSDDVAICISKSGKTVEIEQLMQLFKRYGLPTIAITSGADSFLALHSDVCVLLPTAEEGEPLGIIPTTSVVTSIAIGDAIAAALVVLLEITPDRFREFHPGGSLGHMLTKVSELMHNGDELPIVAPNSTLRDAIIEITRKRLGTAIVITDGTVLGIVTDGDVRRAVQNSANALELPVFSLMTRNPKTISIDSLVEEALLIMEQNKITSLVVTDRAKLAGLLHLHDILAKKLV
jgi:arabinose-5-phosphate isomerase